MGVFVNGGERQRCAAQRAQRRWGRRKKEEAEEEQKTPSTRLGPCSSWPHGTLAHKEATYLELAGRNQYGELTVLACETGGRWHHRALSMVSILIEAKTQTIAPFLRQAAALAYHRRWWGILSTALQRTVATSLLDHPGMGNMPGPSPEPPLGDLLQIPEVSRLPLRDD